MKRVALAIALAGTAALALVAATGAGGEASDRARIDAIFDNAAFLVPGQQLKIAGAEVGEVLDVRLTPDHRALIEMEVDRQFAPFRADSDCTIQPQSLIGEKFIQCAPGSPRARPLPVRDGVQTVPVGNTHAPVDLDLVLATFDLPTRQRAALLIDALGAGLAGRASELNAVLRRASPALQATDRTLAVLDANRRDLRAVIGEAERVVGALSRDGEDVGRFLDRSAEVTTTIAGRGDALETTINGLPRFLDEVRPTFRMFERLAAVGTPAARELRAAARPARELLGEIPAFSADARPALRALARAARRSVGDVRASRPLVGQLRTFAAEAQPAGVGIAELFTDMRERGVVEGLQTFVYYTAAALARFDGTSHILPAFLLPESQCVLYARQPVRGCSAHFASSATAQARTPAREQSAQAQRPPSHGDAEAAAAAPRGRDLPPTAGSDGLAPVAQTEQREIPDPAPSTSAARLLDFLLR